MSSSQTTQHTSRTASPRQEKRRARLWAVGAGIALLVAIAWGAVVVAGWGAMIEDLPRTEVPGEVAVEMAQGEGQVVYVERETWVAVTPLDIDVELEVSGPDGDPVPVEPYDTLVDYRWFGVVGQAYATFDATTSGTHIVAVEGQVDADTRITVGPSLSTWPFWQLAGPAVLLVLALALGIAALAVWQRGRTTASDGSD